jgi:MFS family permease
LSFVYVLNFLDRQLLSILAKPIQDELGVTDGQLGLISGLYFALFYCLLAIPVGWLADRSNRVRVLSFACALWSAATAACGMVSSYPQLAAARMSVGVGEAGACRRPMPSSPTTSHRERAARPWGCSISGRPSVKRWAWPSVLPSRRRTAGARPSSRWDWSVS